MAKHQGGYVEVSRLILDARAEEESGDSPLLLPEMQEPVLRLLLRGGNYPNASLKITGIWLRRAVAHSCASQ